MRRALFAVLICLACKEEQPGEDTPYPGCERIANGDPCGEDGACFNQEHLTVCQPFCDADSDCPSVDGSTVRCAFGALCQISCETVGDCPSGMLCSEIKACAWPKD